MMIITPVSRSLALILAVIAAIPAARGESLMVHPGKVTEVLPLRERPSAGARLVARIEPGAVVDTTGPARDGMVPVTSSRGVGWVPGEALAPVPGDYPGPCKMMVDPSKIHSVLRLRTGPSVEDAIFTRLPPGTRVLCHGPVKNGFAQVSTPMGNGWSHSWYLAPADRGPARATTGTAPDTGSALLGVSFLGGNGKSGGAGGGAGNDLPDTGGGDPGAFFGGNPMGERMSVVSSPYGPRPWIRGPGSRVHRGIDLRTSDAPGARKPVIALGKGTVKVVGWDREGGGNCLVVHHDSGHRTSYMHLSSFQGQDGTTYPGMPVIAGQKLGVTGNTGLQSQGPHLHFELFLPGGDRADPWEFGPIGRTFTADAVARARWTRGGWDDPRVGGSRASD